MASPSAVTGTIATTSLLAGGRRKLPPQLAGHPVARIIRRVRLLALGDRNPDFLTHREIDAALQPQVGTSQSGELHPILSAWLRAAAVYAAR